MTTTPPPSRPPPGPTAEELASLWQRTAVRLRRAVNNGVGWLVFGLAMLCTCALTGRMAWDLSDRRTRAVEERIATLLKTEFFTQGRFRRLGLVSAILADANDPATLSTMDCTQATPDCRAMQRLHSTFLSLVKTALTERDCTGPFPPSSFWNGLASERSRAHARSLWQATARLGGKARAGRAYGNLGRCRSSVPPGARVAALGKARCRLRMPDTLTQLLVPPQLSPDAPADGYKSRVTTALWLSDLLDPALQSVLLPTILDGSDGDPESWRLVQAYFISTDSVLRIWQRTPLDTQEELSPATLWAAAPYFTALQFDDKRTQVTTPIYLDVGGHGMVRSTCSAIDDGVERSPSRRHFVGILCTDFAVPEGRFIAAVARSPLFRVATVHLPTDGPAPEQVNVRFANLPGDLASGSRSAWPADDPGTNELTRPVQNAVASAMKGSKSARSDLTELAMPQGRAYLLPLANHGDRRLTGLVLFPSPLGPQRLERACTGVAFGSGAAAVIAAAFGWLGKRRNAELERRLALLRNLQVGVIEVNARTEITFANDRAEELFGTCLPKGTRDRSVVALDTLIDPTRIVEEVDGHEARGQLTDVLEARRQGSFSTYYARVHDRRDSTRGAGWLRISGTPLLAFGPLGSLTARRVAFGWTDMLGRQRSGIARRPSSFAVVERLPDARCRELEGRYGAGVES